MTPLTTRILLVDDHAVARNSLRMTAHRCLGRYIGPRRSGTAPVPDLRRAGSDAGPPALQTWTWRSARERRALGPFGEPPPRGASGETPIARGSVTGVTGHASRAGTDRVVERRRAVALARHYREFEGLSIRQIADRLGRSPATVKAYFYDPSDANKGLSREREAKAGGCEPRSHLPTRAPRGKILLRRTFLCARLGGPARPVGQGF